MAGRPAQIRDRLTRILGGWRRGFVTTDPAGRIRVVQFTTSADVVKGDGTIGPPAVGGITQLTGDVTAGPGTGSQVATIAANVVSNTKLRDSVGTSVIGRSANSTGDPGDIQATADNQIAVRRASTLGFTPIQDVGYWSVLTNSDPAAPEVIFDSNGDVIESWQAL